MKRTRRAAAPADGGWREARARELIQFFDLSAADAWEAAERLATHVLFYSGGSPLPNKPIMRLDKLAAVGAECRGRIADGDDRFLVAGFLSTLPHGAAASGCGCSGCCWHSADAGTLVLCDGRDGGHYLAFSACSDALPPPELLGAFVIASAWTLVPPAAGVLRGSDGPPYLELDKPLLPCLPASPRPPPTPSASFSVEDAWASVLRMEAAGAPQLLHLRGELIALSEPFVSKQAPVFFAELASAGGSCCVVAFVGHKQMRFRGVMQLGHSYILTNLRQGRVEDDGLAARPLLRTSDDATTRAHTFVHSVSPPSAASGDSRSQVALPAYDEYKGVVTGWHDACIVELDGASLLFLTHQPRRARLGVRVGARVRVSSIHPLQDGVAPSRGFGLCMRGHLSVEEHAQLAPANVGQHHHTTHKAHLRSLARELTLHELASVVTELELHKPAGSWTRRWADVLTPAEQRDALCRWLAAHELTPLAPSSHCPHGECTAHAAECYAATQRAHIPPFPMLLADAAQRLRSLSLVAHALKIAGKTRQPQLLLAEALRAPGQAHPPQLVGKLVEQEQLSSTQPIGERQLVLRDATASVPLLLPRGETLAPPLPGVWVVGWYDILVEPVAGQAHAELFVWTRLFSPEPPLTHVHLPLFPLSLPTSAPVDETPLSFAPPGAVSLSDLLASNPAGPQRREVTRDVYCVLHSRTNVDTDKLLLQLSSDDKGSLLLPLYDVEAASVPVGMLPGCGLLVEGLQLRHSKQRGNRYGKLVSTGRLVATRLPPSVAPSALPTSLSLLAAIPRHGPPLPLLRLHITVLRLMHLRVQLRQGVGSAILDVEATAEVTDNTGRAYLHCYGGLVWVLLQASERTVDSLRDAAASSGTLVCDAQPGTQGRGPKECLSAGRGQWTADRPIDDRTRAALASIWPSSASQRFVASVDAPRPPHAKVKDERESVCGGALQTMMYEPRYRLLTACALTPLDGRAELERLLGL